MMPGIGAGTRFGPYEILGWLGAGGMGEVYRARDTRLGRDVALKLISAAVTADPARLRRFEQEARAAAAIAHPNILALHDIGVQDGVPYIVSELLEGESLRSRLESGPLPLRKALDIARHAADGLAAAHDKGIIHRDIKPDNLFITADGRVKILDFGIAKLSVKDAGATRTGLPTETAEGSVIGTARYMSPEQARGETVDARSDIFSLGAVLYEMISGRAAFARDTAADTMAAVLKDDVPELTLKDAPPAIVRVVGRCLEKTREARFQSARDLAFGLDLLSGTQPAAAVVVAARPRWRAAPIVAIAGLGLMIAMVNWLARPASQNTPSPLADATFSPFTDFEGSELDAAISPDGKFVAFMSDRDGPFHAWVKQVGTGAFVDLTPGRPDMRNAGPNRSVGFSGDGGEIWLAGSTGRRVTLLPLVGGAAPRPFLPEHTVNVAWSRDGGRLVYFTYDGDPMIVADATAGNPREVIKAKAGDHNHYPAFSADGRWIYYAHASASILEFDVWRVPSGGGTAERLTELRTDVRYVTPIDDRTVLFVAPDSDASGPWLWTLDVETKVIRRATIGMERYLSVAASADGRRLVATVAKSTAGIWSMPIRDRLVEETEITTLSLPTARALAPRFGTDTMFFLSSSGGGDGLWRMQNGQAAEVRMGTGGSLVEAPSISRQGDRVAVVHSVKGKERITIVSADGADSQSLSEAIEVRGTSDWAPDGRSLVSGGSDAKGPGLFRIPVDGGAPARLMSGPGTDPVLSPDGQLIVYLGQQTAFAQLLAMKPDGTQVTLPYIRLLTGGRGRARFLPDGKGLVYLQGEAGSQDFWLLDLTTMKSRQITHLSNPATITTFDIARDGSHIVFDRVRERGDIVLIDIKK